MELGDGIAEKVVATGSDSEPPPLVEGFSSETYAASVSRQLLSFEDANICRAIPFHKVVRRGAMLLATSQRDFASYDMSRAVKQIDAFLSHNWATPRVWKFLALVLHFNTWKSIALAVLTNCSTTLIAAAGHFAGYKDPYVGRVAEAGFLVTTPVTFLALFMSHDILDLVGVGGSQVFLDKACIHQRDEVLKRNGIKKLSAFLACSSSLVICYSDTYLQKLWTLYEIGTFLCLGKPINAIYVRPHFEPVIICGALMFFFIVDVLERLMARWAPHLVAVWTLCALLVSAVGGITSLRILSHRRNRASCNAANCRIDDATCAVASDRDEVYNNIANLIETRFRYGYSKTVALRAFDEFIRTEVPRAMLLCSGRAGLPYRYMLLVLIPSWSTRMEKWTAALALEEVDGRVLLLKLLEITMRWLAIYPLQIALVSNLAKRLLLLPRWAEFLFVLFLALIYVGLVLALGNVTERLCSAAGGSDEWLAGFIAWTVLLAGGTAWFYRPYRTDAPQIPQRLPKVSI